MSSEDSSLQNSSVPSSKQMKKLQKEFQKKKEQFYIKKRGLFRKAEQVARHCNTNIFIVAYNNDTNNMFTFQSDPKFNLEKISELVLKDVQQGMLYRNKKFIDEDFDQVKQNLKSLKKEKKHVKSDGENARKKTPKVMENIICNNEDSSNTNSQNTETIEELSMPMIKAVRQQEPSQFHEQPRSAHQHHMSQHAQSRCVSPDHNQMRSVHGHTPVTHQYTDGHEAKQTSQAMYYQQQMPEMYTPRATGEMQAHQPSGNKYFTQTPYARHTYATAAPFHAENSPDRESYHHMPPQYHQQSTHFAQNTLYHPHQHNQSPAPVSQFQQHTEPRVSHFLQENDRRRNISGATRGSVTPPKNKSRERMVQERQMRQVVNCDDIFMCADRDYIRSRSRSRSDQRQFSKPAFNRENSMNNDFDRNVPKQVTPFEQVRVLQPDIKKVNVQQGFQSFTPLRTPQSQDQRQEDNTGRQPNIHETPQFEKVDQVKDPNMIYNPVSQQYNYAININYAQPESHEQESKQEFEFLDVKKGQMAKTDGKKSVSRERPQADNKANMTKVGVV